MIADFNQRELILITLVLLLVIVVYLTISAVEYTVERMAISLQFAHDINQAIARTIPPETVTK